MRSCRRWNWQRLKSVAYETSKKNKRRRSRLSSTSTPSTPHDPLSFFFVFQKLTAALRPRACSPPQQMAFAWYSRIQGSAAAASEANSTAAAAVPWRLLPLSPARSTPTLPWATPPSPLSPATTTRPPPGGRQGQGEGGTPLVPLRADSVRRKRKHKMNKHKHRKRRKLLRHKSK